MNLTAPILIFPLYGEMAVGHERKKKEIKEKGAGKKQNDYKRPTER